MQLLDVRGAAEYLGVSEWWVRHYAAAGELPIVRLGGLIRFQPEALDEWAAAGGTSGVVHDPSRSER